MLLKAKRVCVMAEVCVCEQKHIFVREHTYDAEWKKKKKKEGMVGRLTISPILFAKTCNQIVSVFAMVHWRLYGLWRKLQLKENYIYYIYNVVPIESRLRGLCFLYTNNRLHDDATNTFVEIALYNFSSK